MSFFFIYEGFVLFVGFLDVIFMFVVRLLSLVVKNWIGYKGDRCCVSFFF